MAEVTLTNAQVLALPTTAIQIVAAIPDGIIYLLFAHARMEWVADYTNIDAGSLINLSIGGSDTVWPLRQGIGSSVSALLAGGGPDGTHAFFSPRFANGAALSDSFGALANFYDADLVNLPLKISLNNGAAGDLTGGDAGNSLTVQAVYMILPV